jgi:hypothetical protein
VNAPPALATRPPSSPVPPWPADEDLGLAALLDLFAADEPEAPQEAAPSARRSLRATAGRLHAWMQESLRRASAWGAGPGGVWRAW